MNDRLDLLFYDINFFVDLAQTHIVLIRCRLSSLRTSRFSCLLTLHHFLFLYHVSLRQGKLLFLFLLSSIVVRIAGLDRQK